MRAELVMSASARLTFRSPRTVIARFVARRTVRSASFLALIFGIYVASKSAGYVAAYPTAAARAEAIAALGSNIGLVAMLGPIPKILSVASGAVWNTLPVMAIVSGIWAFLLATKSFRGEEEAGRWELLLSGQTSPRRAAANTLVGLSSSILALYLVTAITFILIGKIHGIDFGISGALFFALAATSGAAMFLGVGALASQLMPTRAAASSLSVMVFGICFLLRAVGDVTKTQVLTDMSPLGWIANLHPLYDPRPVWLIPIGIVTVGLCTAAIYLAGRRDLGDSLFADRGSAKPHYLFLRGPITAAIRLTRTSSASWLAAVSLLALVMGLLTKAAAQAFDNSPAMLHVLGRLSHASNLGAVAYLGVVFFMLMTLVMCYAASAVGRMREEEAEGYLDNLLVRSVSRTRWLLGRAALIATVIASAGLLSSVMVWVSIKGQNTGVSFHTLLSAGVNTMVPAFLVLGIGMFCLGLAPRLSTVITFSVIGWSFLLDMVASGINLNHWILDTSVFHHVAFAPAADPVWRTAWILVGLAVAGCIAGVIAFNSRDLAGN